MAPTMVCGRRTAKVRESTSRHVGHDDWWVWIGCYPTRTPLLLCESMTSAELDFFHRIITLVIVINNNFIYDMK